jgi:hypothetical protein
MPALAWNNSALRCVPVPAPAGEVDLARMLLRVLHQLLDRLVRARGVHDHDRGSFGERVDRGEILQRVVAHLAVQRQVGRHRALRAVYPRVAVGRRAGRHFRADHAARTGAVFTTTDCFNVSDIFLAMVRDAVSVMPPGVNGTIR